MLVAVFAVFRVGPVLSAAAPITELLILARVLLGLAIDTSSLVGAGLHRRNRSPVVRGRLVSMNQLVITIGIFVSYSVGYAFADSGDWRWMLGIVVVPSVAMFFRAVPAG